MSIHRLPGLDPEHWYVIDTDYGQRTHRPPWQERKLSLHGPNCEASVSWSLFGKHGFGLGFMFGHNGDESDLGLDLYCGRLASVWLRLRAPWTRWAQSKAKRDKTYSDSGDKDWYKSRHYGLRVWPRRGVFIEADVRSFKGEWSSTEPWYRHMKLDARMLLGGTRTERIEMDSGTCRVPLPEGVYDGTYTTERMVWSHVRYPGKIRDWFGKRSHISTTIEVPGGIPVEGKGENSWDCGMDGIFSSSGPGRVEQAIGSLVASVQRCRNRYGGPHNLERPMTVQEAANR